MINDRQLLMCAVKLAGDGIKEGNGPFGAIVTREGKIISEACNVVVKSHDPTAHAEIMAIRKASDSLGTHDLSDCVIYTSCEPCPMCLGAIYWSGIKKVVYASDRISAESAGFSDSYIYKEIVLEPALRSISFIQIPDSGGEEVFAKWKDFDDRVPY